jgi:hypothetical protein
MIVIWLGMALVFSGMLFMVFRAIGPGPLSAPRRSRSAGLTLEPPTHSGARAFGLKANWPGYVLIGLGALLLLVGAILLKLHDL